MRPDVSFDIMMAERAEAEERAANPDVEALWQSFSKFHEEYQVWGSRGYLKSE